MAFPKITLDEPDDRDDASLEEGGRGFMDKLAETFLGQFSGADIGVVHAVIASAIMTVVVYDSAIRGQPDLGYDSQANFTVYPEQKLIIVSGVSAAGKRFSIDVRFAQVIALGIGLDEAILLDNLAPLADQTRTAMAEVLALAATLRGHNS